MSRFLYHTSCPRCGSRDNVAVYDDGHGWCFGCRKVVIEPEQRLVREKKRREAVDDNRGSGGSIHLPDDYSTDIPVIGLTWLQKYELSLKEIREHRIGWSQTGWMIRKSTPNPCAYAPLMIFPIFDPYDNLLMYQARYFGSSDGENLPKYWTVGNRGVLHILGEGSTITLVEDLISAIKVSRHCASMPIFGSNVATEIILPIYNRFRHLILWLDKDKRDYAHARSQSLRYMFDSVKVINSEADPKDYNDAELRQFLRV